MRGGHTQARSEGGSASKDLVRGQPERPDAHEKLYTLGWRVLHGRSCAPELSHRGSSCARLARLLRAAPAAPLGAASRTAPQNTGGHLL